MLFGLLIFFSGLLISATPLPYIYLYVRQGRRAFWPAAWLSLLVVFLAYFLGAPFFSEMVSTYPNSRWLISIPGVQLIEDFPANLVMFFGMGYFVFYLAVAYAISNLLLHPKNIYRDGLRWLFGIFFGTCLMLIVFILPYADTFLTQYYTVLGEAVQATIVEIQNSSDVDSEWALYATQGLKLWADNSLYLLPILFFASVSFVFALNVIVAKRIFFPFRPEFLLIQLTGFRLPFNVVWVMIGTLALALLNSKFLHILPVAFVCTNLLFGLFILYFFQGLAVFIFTLDIRGIRGLIRIALYIFAFYLFVFTFILLTFLGFFDSWMDLRGRLVRARAS